MSKLSMTIPRGTTRVFHTAGTYCDKDIVVTAEGGGSDEAALFVAVNNNTLTDFTLTADMGQVRDYMFYGNSNLKTADLSAAYMDAWRAIGAYSFYQCTGLESVVFPKSNSEKAWIGGRAFLGCTNLKEVYIPINCNFTTATNNIFQNCTALTKVIAPLTKTSNSIRVFDGCSALTLVDILGGVIGNAYFSNCSVLTTLVLRSESVTALATIAAFDGTPFASGGTGGTVYVPQALIEQYQTATNWSTLYVAGTCNFVAIEGSEYE